MLSICSFRDNQLVSTVNAPWKYHRNIYDVPLFISLIIFSAGSSRSSPVLSIGMTPAPQAPQQPQMHQPRGFNLGGYVLIRIPWMVDAVELSKEKQALFFPFFSQKSLILRLIYYTEYNREEKKSNFHTCLEQNTLQCALLQTQWLNLFF